MKHLHTFESFLNEKKPAGAPSWKDSDAPDANGRFRDLGIKDLAAWLIKSRKKDLKKISGSLTQQVVFNRKDDPAYAEKMEKTRQEVYKQLGRKDLLESVKDGVVTCDKCKWHWDIVTGGDDPYTCHKCGTDNLNENVLSNPFANSFDINQVLYGNPPIEYIETIQRPDDHIKEWFINQGLVDSIVASAPTNDSEITKKDLQILLEKMSKATAEEIQFARYVEDVSNLAQSFIDILKENNIEMSMGDFFRIDDQTEGILHLLKDVINRPRPYQLAKYYDLPLFPLIRTDAMSAAYPSGHALTGLVMGQYLANKYSNIATQLRENGEKIANSRELTGIHFPSDTQISREICKNIIENNLLQE